MRTIRVAAIVMVLAGWIGTASGFAADEPNYQGRGLSYWLHVIHERNDEMIALAFDAVRGMGPQAKAAVPELQRIVAAPFVPIRIGKDSDDAIAEKLYDIELRSGAIDALAAIGEAASPATDSVIEWALTIRVVPEELVTRDEDERFIDLLSLDAQYRIRVVDSVTKFGRPAAARLVRMLKSPDVEKRKLAVLILGEDALSLANDLMKSESCEDRQLAITIFGDLQPFVAKIYLAELKRMVVCNVN